MPDPLRILVVALGIGLVIFVHELGHFLAARWCGVRVDVFSLGFGPRLFAWRRGDTVYQIAAIPLGGFVSMAGEAPERERREPAPDELPAKSVPQRFLIFSAGVLMNVAFAIVVFPVLFAVGVPFLRPVLGEPAPGGPAWQAGLEAGTEVLTVNGDPVFDFLHIPTEVALGDPERAVLEVRRPGSETVERVELVPRERTDFGLYSIDVSHPIDPLGRLDVEPGSPAAAAGLATGDRLLGIVGLPDGLTVQEQLELSLLGGEPFTARVAGEGGERAVVVAPEVEPEGAPPRLGIAPVVTQVAALRASPVVDALDLAVGDRIVAIDGEPVLRAYDWELAVLRGSGTLDLTVERDGELRPVEAPVATEAQRRSLADDVALVHDQERARVTARVGEAGWNAGLRDGDRIARIDGVAVDTWEQVRSRVAEAGREGRGVLLGVERRSPDPSAPPEWLEIDAAPAPAPLATFGLTLQGDQYLYRTTGPVEAIRVGLTSSWRFLEDTWLTLKRILLGQVSGENIGGIITISAVSYSWAEAGIAKLLFFLCLLSLNLAFINVLPIPVLDGGHLMFLAIEAVKGSPVSDRVLGYSQVVGLVLIVSLMVYVTYNDLVRWVLG